jgi:hypothetical protein
LVWERRVKFIGIQMRGHFIQTFGIHSKQIGTVKEFMSQMPYRTRGVGNVV